MPKLDTQSIERFHEQGFLVVDDVLDPERDLDPVVDEYTTLLDNLITRWYAEGKLPSDYRGLPFAERLLELLKAGYSGTLGLHQHIDISLPQSKVQADTPIHVGPAVFELMRSPRLLDTIESLIGSEIYSNPVQHIRLKLPERDLPADRPNDSMAITTPWHQDQGVLMPEADGTEVITVWLPVTDATIEKGCLAVVPGSHREGLATHCPGGPGGLRIPAQLMRGDDAVPAPVKRGGVLIMHRQMMHCALPNRSNDLRWSYDLRYHPIGQPTGRPAFPGFIARSRQNPASELRDPSQWVSLWHEARARLAAEAQPNFNRWAAGTPVCA